MVDQDTNASTSAASRVDLADQHDVHRMTTASKTTDCSQPITFFSFLDAQETGHIHSTDSQPNSDEMPSFPRGFGQDHHSADDLPHTMSPTDEYQHIASILSIVITGVTLLGVVCIIIRTLLSLRRPKGSPQDTEDSEEEVGGAKRTRAKLCVALLVSDAWVGISWLAPAAMDLKDEPLQGTQCQIPGTTLATALWWQYGFSVAIAVSTYLALRHPLSRLKDWQERKVGLIICGVVLLGLVQAII